MQAIEFKSYEDYCNARRAQGLQVIPRALWNALAASSN